MRWLAALYPFFWGVPVMGLAQAPEERAVSFLSREVPRWVEEHRCRSCHNNGDAARALLAARRRGYEVPSEALESTLDWLRRPEDWDSDPGKPGFSDRTLARIQFASALGAAIDAGLVRGEAALRHAAELVAKDQAEDGSWKLDASGSLGSPATYGRFLASVTARAVLQRADPVLYREPLARVDRWLREARVETVFDAAAVLLGVADAEDESGRAQRKRCLEILDEGQAPSGGWGPYKTSAPEPFDTAMVILALEQVGEDTGAREKIEAGRRYLLERQIPDGSWPETTRPAGQQSYAQYISTTGWATLALLASREVSPE